MQFPHWRCPYGRSLQCNGRMPPHPARRSVRSSPAAMIGVEGQFPVAACVVPTAQIAAQFAPIRRDWHSEARTSSVSQRATSQTAVNSWSLSHLFANILMNPLSMKPQFTLPVAIVLPSPQKRDYRQLALVRLPHFDKPTSRDLACPCENGYAQWKKNMRLVALLFALFITVVSVVGILSPDHLTSLRRLYFATAGGLYVAVAV